MKALLAGMAALALTLISAPGADSETGVPLASPVADLPLTEVTDSVLDAANDQLFVSSRPEGRVAVADLETGRVTRLPYLADAGPMDLDDSGTHLWVSLRTEGAVARVSTVAPFDATIFPLGRRCLGDLVATAGKVYVVADDDCLQQWDEFVMLDPETGQVTESTAEPGSHGTIYHPTLRQIPGTSRFHWQSNGITGSPSGIIDAATDSTVATGANFSVLAVMPDGENLLTINGDLRSTTDLSLTGHLTVPPIQHGGPAISPDGLLAYPQGDDVVVYDLNGGTTVGRWQFDPVDGYGAERTFWDGSALYAVGARGPVRIAEVADVHAPRTSVLTVTDPESGPVPRGSEVTVSGRLVDGTGSAIPDAPIEIRVGNTRELLASPVTGDDGTWSAVVRLDWYSLRVLFPGDASHEAATVTQGYWIEEARRFLSVDGPVAPAPTDTLIYEGRVVDQQGKPLPDVPVNVEWHCGDRGIGAYVMTRADGSFRYDLAAPPCDQLTVYFYVDGLDGNWGNSGHAVVETDIGWIMSELTAHGPEQVAPGESGTWTAALTIDGSPAPNEVVLFRSQQVYGWETGSLTTDAEGVVTLTTDAVSQDANRVEFRYAGDSTTLGSTATVATRVAPWPSTLTVSPDSETPTAGEPLTFTGSLTFGDGRSAEDRIVQFTEWGDLIATARVGADGSFSLTHRPTKGLHNWSFRFAGDAQHAAVTTVVPVSVSERTATLTTTRVAASSLTRAEFTATADPGYSDMCLRFRVDRRTADGWRKVTTSRCRLTGEAGATRYRTSRDLPVAGRYRVRPTFAGDAFTAPTKGTWQRFRLG